MNPGTDASRRFARGGFTLMELIVVMGILAGFLTMLVQFLDSGVRLFDEGESGQAIADRAQDGQQVLEKTLLAMRGPAPVVEPGPPAARMLLQLLPLGLATSARTGDTKAQVLRTAIHLDPDVELAMVEGGARARAAAELGHADAAALEKRVQELLAVQPLRGLGNLLLLAVPEGDGGVLTLRAGRFLPGQTIQVTRDKEVDPMLVPVPGSPDLPVDALVAATTPLLTDVLHFELRCWSQRTTAWNGGDEIVWDSARAGWLDDPATGPVFGLDKNQASYEDTNDDVYPHAVRVVLVVAPGPNVPPEGLLAGELGPDDTTLHLLDGDRFPGPADGGHVKVEGEWIRYASRDGDRLLGLQRGERWTRAAEHERGARVRVGRSIEFTVPVAHARDDWNG